MPVPHTGHPPQRTTPPMGQPIRPHQPQPRLPPAALPAPCRTPSRPASPDTGEARDVCLGHPRSHMRIVGCRADASRGAPAMRATRGAPTDEQPRDSSDMQGQPAPNRPRSYPARTGSVSARRYAARARRHRQSKPASGALRGARSRAVHALAAPIARKIAQMALTVLGLSGHPFHDPFHARRPYIPAMHTADLPMAARRAESG